MRHLVRGCQDCVRRLEVARLQWQSETESEREERYDKPLDRAFASALKMSRALAAREKRVEGLLPALRHQGKLRQTADIQRERLKSARLYDKASPLEHYEAYRRLSWEERYRDPAEMVRCARAAFHNAMCNVSAAEVGGEKKLVDLRVRAQCELANAWRVYNDYGKAWGNLKCALGMRLEGTRDEATLARLLDVKASLYADQRDFEAAQECLGQVVRIYRRLRLHPLVVKILVQQGTFHGYAGDLHEAISHLQRVLPQIDPKRYADLALSVRFNLASFLADAGEHREARRHAWGLARSFEDNGQILNAAKVRWLAAKIHLALGELERAERELEAARTGFLEAEDGFLAGLITLELALLVHRRLRTGEAVALATEALQIFKGLGIGRDAIATLTFLHTLLGDRQARAERLREIFEDVSRKLRAEREAEAGRPRNSWLDP